MFPNDTKFLFFDSINDTSCTSTYSVLLPTEDHDRTILLLSTNNKSNRSDSGADVHIGWDGYPNLFFDGERASYLSSYSYGVLPANQFLYCKKGSTPQEYGEHISFSVLYVDYNLASTTSQIGTSTTSTQIFVNGFSYGDIIISFFLFFLSMMIFFLSIYTTIRGIKIKQ